MACRIKMEMEELERESVLGLDPEARGKDQPGSELSILAVMGAQGPQGFNLDCLSLAPSKGGRDDVILEGSLAEWEDLCHSLCGHGVRSLRDTGSFLSEVACHPWNSCCFHGSEKPKPFSCDCVSFRGSKRTLGRGQVTARAVVKGKAGPCVLCVCVGIGVHLSMTTMYIHAEPRVHAWGPQTRELCVLLFLLISLR